MNQLDISADASVNTEGLDMVLQGSRINLLENKGEIVEQLTKNEIVNQIYIETNMLNTIQSLGLTTYIPTYLRG